MSSVRLAWVLGWAVPEVWFAPLARRWFPDAEHVFVTADGEAIARLRLAPPFSWVIGYSLGAHLLLAAAADGRLGPLSPLPGSPRVALLAPIFAFPSEEKLGGRASRTQVRYLARALQHDRAAALTDFYARAGLDIAEDLAPRGESAAKGLVWGLKQLESGRIEPPLPPGWRAWCGAEDALLDAARLRALAPEIRLVPDSTHHPEGLLRAFADDERIATGSRRHFDGAPERVIGPQPHAGTLSLRPRASLEAFNRVAPTYAARARVQTAMAEWLAEWLPPSRGGRALEIGAGPGVFTRLLLPWNGSLTATDLAPAMCEAGQVALPQAEWRVMAAETPLDGPWDWIFSSSMLQWARNPSALFTSWRERLAPGGWVLAGFFVEGSLPEWEGTLAENGPVTWRSVEEWRACMARGGLDVVRDEVETRVFWHPTAHAFLRSLHDVGASSGPRVSPGRLRRLLREHGARNSRDEGVPATWRFYRCLAENRKSIMG